MRMARVFTLVTLVLIAVASCNREEEPIESYSCTDGESTWLLTESGYSDGGSYTVKPVGANPPKKLALLEDGTMHSTMDGFSDYRYYVIVRDNTFDLDVISFFVDEPDREGMTLEDLEFGYNMVIDQDTLTLSYRWCIEGCHLGFVRCTSGTSAAETGG